MLVEFGASWLFSKCVEAQLHLCTKVCKELCLKSIYTEKYKLIITFFYKNVSERYRDNLIPQKGNNPHYQLK